MRLEAFAVVGNPWLVRQMNNLKVMIIVQGADFAPGCLK